MSDGELLTQPTLRAASFLAITDAELSLILGVGERVIVDMRAGRVALDLDSEAFKRAALFLGIWMAVDSFFAHDDVLSQRWLRRPDASLCDATPLELMATAQGLETVRGYTVRLEEAAEYSSLAPQNDLERQVQERAVQVLGTPAAAAQWLLNEQSSLAGRFPRELMRSETGAREVLRVLDLIDFGEYI